MIDGALKTDDVLNRTINGLDVRGPAHQPEQSRRAQPTDRRRPSPQAVKDSLIARLKDLACSHLPDVISSLVCG